MKWEVKKLGDLCDILDKRRKPISKQHRISGKYPYYGATGIVDYINDYIFSEKLILVGEDGAKWGTGEQTAFAVDGKYWVNNHAHVIKPDRNRIIDGWIIYYLNHLDLSDYITGVTVPKLNQNKLVSIEIPVPPIEEQKRIVQILDKTFESIAKAEANTLKNFINASKIFDSYLNSSLINFVLQETPQTLADITELIVDCEHKTAPNQETGYPSIRTPNIGKGYLTLDNVYRVSEETYQEWTRRAKPQANDLILAREAPAGNVGIVPEGEKVCLGQRTVLIRPKKTINSQYLAFYLLHPEMQKQLLSKSSGATVQHVNMKDIRSLKISYFPSREVQQKLAEALLSVQSRSKQLETIYQRKLEALAELKQSILQKAFTGQLSQ